MRAHRVVIVGGGYRDKGNLATIGRAAAVADINERGSRLSPVRQAP